MSKQDGLRVQTCIKAGTWRDQYNKHLEACSKKYETILAVPTCLAHSAYQATVDQFLSQMS